MLLATVGTLARESKTKTADASSLDFFDPTKRAPADPNDVWLAAILPPAFGVTEAAVYPLRAEPGAH